MIADTVTTVAGAVAIASFIGVVVCGFLMIQEARAKRRLARMREEADRKRDDCYFVLSDKLEPKQRNPRAGFLP